MAMGQLGKIRGNMTPDPKWKLRGDIVDSQPVYVEGKPNIVRTVRLDGEGKEMWHTAPNGEKLRPKYMLKLDPDEPVIFRDFIMADLGNGIVQKHYDFDPSPADLERQKNAIDPGVSQREMRDLIAAQAKQLDELRKVVMGRAEAAIATAEEDNDMIDADDLEVETVKVAAKAKPARKRAPRKTAAKK